MEKPAGAVSFPSVARELSPPIQRYLERYVGDAALAADLLQETLIRIARGLPAFAGRASVKTWAFSIATRVAADHFRRRENRLRIVPIDESAAVPATALDADERMIVDEMSACMRQVIDSLPEDYRSALVLHDLEGLTAQQAADVCDCSLATAKIRIHRARLRLKEALQQQCEFYRDRDDVLRCDRKE